MNNDDLLKLKNDFGDYCQPFFQTGPEDERNLRTKLAHTREVSSIAAVIATELGMPRADVLLAEAAGLLHDIGRFPQYAQYKTFNDRVSVNHGVLGAKVLLESRMLTGLSNREQDIVMLAVKFHNAYAVPPAMEAEAARFTRIVRDADKLDIWHVVIGYLSGVEQYQSVAIGLGLQETPGYSPDALEAVLSGKLVRMADLKNLNDLKLVQLAWAYDLNFEPSIRMLAERGYIDQLARLLPETEEIARAVDVVRTYIRGRLQPA